MLLLWLNQHRSIFHSIFGSRRGTLMQNLLFPEFQFFLEGGGGVGEASLHMDLQATDLHH